MTAKTNNKKTRRAASRSMPRKARKVAGDGKSTRKPAATGASSIDLAPSALRALEPALCIIGDCNIILWSLTPADRFVRQFVREGIAEVLSIEAARVRNGPVVFVRADAVIDAPLIAVLARRPNFVLSGQGPDGAAPVAVSLNGVETESALAILTGQAPRAGLQLITRSPGDLGASFWKALRKRETPYALIVGASNRANVEWRMFMGTYKGATDFVTKHLWPRPAFFATRWLAPRGVSPNMVTTVGAGAMVIAFWLFLEGHYGWGLAAAWLMTFLDTVDGKLARTTLTSSKWGDVFDHGIDLIHPPFWYFAWGFGLARVNLGLGSLELWSVLGTILTGYALQRLIEGIAIKWLGLEVHIWRPIDTAFRQITARRNPNLVILTVSMLLARPDLGLVAVAAWTVLCLALHAIQLFQAFAAKARTGPLISWMSRAPERP